MKHVSFFLWNPTESLITMYPMTSDSLSFAFTGSQLKDTLLPSWIHMRLVGGWAGAEGRTWHSANSKRLLNSVLTNWVNYYTSFTRGFRAKLTGSLRSIYSMAWLASALHSRAFLVLAVTAAVAGPWPMLLKPFTVMWYRLLPSRPVKTMDVSFFTVLCFFPDSSCSVSFQELTC